MEYVKVNIELVGGNAEVNEFLDLCAKIQVIGQIGSCMTIPVTVDGDGSGRLVFQVSTENKDGEVIDLTDSVIAARMRELKEKVDELEKTQHFIGE